ncbi:hypothetical protein FRB97_006066, partial [Tulasnella sp. 331]
SYLTLRLYLISGKTHQYKACVETSKHHDKLANHFRTAHGVNLAALSNELGPLYKGIPIVTPTPIEPLPAHIDSYRPSLPTIRKATKRSRHSDRHQRKDEDEEMNSLFGSGSSRSDSKSKLPAVAGSSSSSCLVPLPPSPRKKRGARITRAIVDPDVVPPNPTYLAEDDLVYGDAPGGEYAPREGYRIWEPTPWLDMEKPEMATYKNPLPPVYHRVRSVYPTPPVTQLDREPVVITRHIGVGTEPEGNQQQAQSPSAPATSTPLDVNSGVKRGQPIGFVALWEAMRSTPVGQTLDAARKKEAAEEAVKELAKAAQAARRLAGRKHPDTASWEPSLSSDIPPIMQEDSSANALPVTPKRRLGLQTARKHGTRPCLLGAVSIQASGSPPSLPSPSLDVNGSSASSGSLPTTRRRPAGLQSARKTGSKPSHVIRLSDADKRLRITSPEEGGGAQ